MATYHWVGILGRTLVDRRSLFGFVHPNGSAAECGFSETSDISSTAVGLDYTNTSLRGLEPLVADLSLST